MPEETDQTPAITGSIEKPETSLTASKERVEMTDSGLQLRSLDGLWRFAQIVARSGFAPKGFGPESVCIAIQMGSELGLKPMASIQNIAVINGRPSIWGDAMLGVIRASGELESFSEWYEVKGQKIDRQPQSFEDDTIAICQVKRKGCEIVIGSFSVGDAKRGKLWGKDSPWSTYPARMLRFRARSYALRDAFGDALRGLLTAEEASDLPPVQVSVESIALPAPVAIASPRIEDSTPPPAATATPKEKRKAKTAETPQGEMTLGDKDKGPREKLADLIKFHEFTEAEVIAAAKQGSIPMKATIADSSEGSVKIITDDFETVTAMINIARANTKA